MREKDKHTTGNDAEPTRRMFVKQVTVGAVGLTAGQMLPSSVGAAKKKIDAPESSLQGVAECLTEAREATVKALPSKALNLSEKARTTAIQSEWLNTIRDILLRQNAWENMPLHPQEIFVAQPQVAEVVTIDPSQTMPVDIYSMGYGNIDFDWSSGRTDFSCPMNGCADQTITGDGPTGCDDQNTCGFQACGDQSCTLNDCGENHCTNQECKLTGCEKHTAGYSSLAQDLRSNFSNPFVHEISKFFQVRNPENLAVAVSSFVIRNAYDSSALARTK